jgi:hypothetical protein
VNWKKTLLWSALIFLAAFGVGLSVSALNGSEAVVSIAIFASSSSLYFFFLRRTPRRLLHALAAFITVEIIDWGIPLLLGASFWQMLADWDSSAKHLGAAILGLTIAHLSSNNSFKPKPLRGSA